MTASPPGQLDMNVADDEEFSPDKLRSNIERLYMTVIIGLMTAGKHVARLRSWRESRRTTAFCVAYFGAWAFDLLGPLCCISALALIVYPRARRLLFPPAPLALVDSKTGGLQKPKAGVLGSHDSVTGAPENHKGEAVEAEASNFVTGIASIALASASGKHPQGQMDDDDEAVDNSVPDPSAIALGAADAKETAAGSKPTKAHDKTKVPMETAMWNKMRPIMQGLTDVVDTWERFGNALSPTPPFPRNRYRLRLAGLVLPMLIGSFFVNSYMIMKGTGFAMGFGFFGDPIIQRGIVWLNRKFPHWQKLLEIRNTLLKGVPTNAQLTITLLRIGEANKAPLPPPPRADGPPPDQPAKLTASNLQATGADAPLDASKEELAAAIRPDSTTAHKTAGTDVDASKTHSHGSVGSKILGFFKGTTAATVQTAISIDTLKAKAGSAASKNRVGVVPHKRDALDNGPIEFQCRYKGHKGHAYITTRATIPCVAFSTDKTIEKIGTQEREDLHPAWTIAVADIAEMKKVGGYGWKAKLVVGWALSRQIKDGVTITNRQGDSWTVTAMPERDEMFNRLAAMGGQKWISE
jgi:hypothetical protein